MNFPPMLYPQPVPKKEIWQAQPAPPIPNAVLPLSTTQNHNWQAAPPQPNTTKYLPFYTTVAQIKSFFRIIEVKTLP